MKRTFLKLFVILSSVFLLDIVTKIWAERTLSLHQPVPLGSDYLRLTLGYNTGVAFGMFSDAQYWPLLVTGCVITGLFIWFLMLLLTQTWPSYTVWPIGMVLGGAIGNFVDRFPDLRVTDFIDVGIDTLRWPTFNIADSFIVVGLCLLLLMTYRQPQDDHEEQTEDTAVSNGLFNQTDSQPASEPNVPEYSGSNSGIN